jgi:hypothetical protein
MAIIVIICICLMAGISKTRARMNCCGLVVGSI